MPLSMRRFQLLRRVLFLTTLALLAVLWLPVPYGYNAPRRNMVFRHEIRLGAVGWATLTVARPSRSPRFPNRTFGDGSRFRLSWEIHFNQLILTAAFSGMVLLTARHLHRALLRARAKAGICLRCGYDLRASSENCPECGLPIPASPPTIPPL